MDRKTAAIILCAGQGSRLGLPDGQNKCAVPVAGTTPVEYTVSSFLDMGVDQVTVVVGYGEKSVRDALSYYNESDRLFFAENKSYLRHGCNYSLACGMMDESVSGVERILIAEGDSLLDRRSIEQMVHTNSEAAVLVRPKRYVDPARSVTTVGRDNIILQYVYDTSHRGVFPELKRGENVIGESMQLWLFSGKALRRLRRLLKEYRMEADVTNTPMLHSGVHSINMLEEKTKPVFSEEPERWINLNTPDDLRKAGNASWLIK